MKSWSLWPINSIRSFTESNWSTIPGMMLIPFHSIGNIWQITGLWNKRAMRPWIVHLSKQAKSQTFNFEIWVTFDQGQRMTVTFDTHSTSLTHLAACFKQLWDQCCNKFQKINNFHFFPYKRYSLNFINLFSWMLQATLWPKAAIVSKKKKKDFHFFPYKSLCDQIWSWRKMCQGEHMVIIWTTLVVLA